MAGRAPAPGHGVKLPVRLYAEAVLAAEFRGRTVGQYVEMAVAAQLERDAHEFKLSRFHAADKEATRKGTPSPLHQDFGLPLPPAFR
jgi:hypothetical protein